MKQQTIFLLLMLCLAITSCQKKIEVIEEKDEQGNVIAKFERRTNDFAKQGFYETYHPSGDVFEKATYQDNKLNGPRDLFYDNGKMQAKEVYENDQLQGTYQTFFRDETLESEGEYINNAMTGVWKYNYTSGKLKEEVNFEGNEENGPFKEYHENGNLMAEGQYENGPYEVGELKKYDEQGAHIETMNCEVVGMGEAVFSKCTSVWKAES